NKYYGKLTLALPPRPERRKAWYWRVGAFGANGHHRPGRFACARKPVHSAQRWPNRIREAEQPGAGPGAPKPGPGGPMDRWTFLTNHAHVFLCIAEDPGIRIRETSQ